MKKAVIFAAIFCIILVSFAQPADAASFNSTKKPSLSLLVLGETLKNAIPQ